MAEPKTVSEQEFRNLFNKGWMTPESMARRWGIATTSVYIKIKRGTVEARKSICGRYYILDPKQGLPK